MEEGTIMNYEKTIEIIDTREVNYQEHLRKRASVGWDLISSSGGQNVNQPTHDVSFKGVDTLVRYGDPDSSKMTLTFRRDKNLKRYDRFVDLDSKISRLNEALTEHKNFLWHKYEKAETSRTILEILVILSFGVLVLLDLLIIFVTSFLNGEYGFWDWAFTFMIILLLISLHVLHWYLKRKLNRSMVFNANDAFTSEVKTLIDKLYAEAKQLDHSLNE